MWLTCVLIVASDTTRRSAIWPLVRPAAISSRTCASRAVKPSGSSRVAVWGEPAAARRRSCARGSRIVWPLLAARSASAISWRPESLVKNPRAPALSASRIEASSACVVRTTTSTPPRRRRRVRACRAGHSPALRCRAGRRRELVVDQQAHGVGAVLERESGVPKRRRARPIPAWTLAAARVSVAIVTSLAVSVLLVIVATNGYDAAIPIGAVPAPTASPHPAARGDRRTPRHGGPRRADRVDARRGRDRHPLLPLAAVKRS